jgi:hypothetical protein
MVENTQHGLTTQEEGQNADLKLNIKSLGKENFIY